MQNKQLQQGTVSALQFACSLCMHVCVCAYNIYIDPSSTNWQLTHNKLAIRVRVQLGRAANFRSVTQVASAELCKRNLQFAVAIPQLQVAVAGCQLLVAGGWWLVAGLPLPSPPHLAANVALQLTQVPSDDAPVLRSAPARCPSRIQLLLLLSSLSYLISEACVTSSMRGTVIKIMHTHVKYVGSWGSSRSSSRSRGRQTHSEGDRETARERERVTGRLNSTVSEVGRKVFINRSFAQLCDACTLQGWVSLKRRCRFCCCCCSCPFSSPPQTHQT